jgi:hypothetical protein
MSVLTVGSEPPAMSVGWVEPRHATDSGFLIFWADAANRLDAGAMCLDCALELGGAQLGRGMDKALELQCSVDYLVDDDDWYMPEDSLLAEEAAKL